MAANLALHTAMSDKNDEFYTLYSDIEREMNSYIDFNPKVFNGKTILLPCDDPEWSNFTRYFAANFERLALKKFLVIKLKLKVYVQLTLQELNH